MNYKDYYKVMGLKREASEKDIKTAYRKFARKYHPDISKEPDAEEKFKELGEAYEVLKDPEKRKIYDQYGNDHESRQARPHHQPQHSWGQSGTGHQFGPDFFESLFGERFNQQQRAGGDYRSDIKISLYEAYTGVVKELLISSQSSGKPLTLRVKIPAGVKTGQQIRLPGQGAPGKAGGPKGNLFLTVFVNEHPLFDVKGNDIYLTLPIAPWEAALGAKMTVPTLGGNVDLKIPPGSQAGQSLRLKKRGLPGASPGDQYIIIKIIIPIPTTDTQIEIYKKMAEEMPFNPREKMRV